jgi:hypothetical protein
MTDTATNARQHEEKIARIRSNRDLSDQAKRRMIREIHEEAAREHNRLVAEAREAREQAVRSAERNVFAISYPECASASEKALIVLSYRDARDRAERAAENRDDPNPLEDLLDRAESTGDTQLAEAAYHVATLRGARSVAEAYLADRPTARSAGGSLTSRPTRRQTHATWASWPRSWDHGGRRSSAGPRGRGRG